MLAKSGATKREWTEGVDSSQVIPSQRDGPSKAQSGTAKNKEGRMGLGPHRTHTGSTLLVG